MSGFTFLFHHVKYLWYSKHLKSSLFHLVMHRCDENSLEFLLYLARHVTSQPFFLLFTYRTEETSPGLSHWLAQLDRERLALELTLVRLSQTEVVDMLQAIFAAPHPLPTELLGSIYTLTEGNPFFVEEMLKSLITTGELQYVDGRWERGSYKSDAGGYSFIPRSVQDAVKQRADRLSAGAKQALTLAAVAGRRFDFTLLQQVLRCDEDQLLSLMKELIADLLVVSERTAEVHVSNILGNWVLPRGHRSLRGSLKEGTIIESPRVRIVEVVESKEY